MVGSSCGISGFRSGSKVPAVSVCRVGSRRLALRGAPANQRGRRLDPAQAAEPLLGESSREDARYSPRGPPPQIRPASS